MPEDLEFDEPAEPMRQVWFALRGNVRSVLESITLADVAADRLSDEILSLAAEGEAPRDSDRR